MILRLVQGLRRIEADPLTVFDVWWEKARSVVGTTERERSWLEFQYAWSSEPSQSFVNSVRAAINSEPFPLESLSYSEQGRQLLACCAVLQRRVWPEPFFVSLQTAAEIVNGSFQSVSRHFRRMQQDGLLERVERGSTLTGKASLYRYLPAWKTTKGK
jgi:hypothetical protein